MEFDVKEFVVNKNSWHYRWMIFYNYLKDIGRIKYYYEDFTPQSWYDKKYIQPIDFCSYWRQAIIFPALRIGLNILLIIPAILAFGFVIYGMITNPMGGITLFSMIFGGILLVIAGLFILGGISHLITKARKRGILDDNIAYMKYKSFKEKTCPMIKYDGE